MNTTVKTTFFDEIKIVEINEISCVCALDTSDSSNVQEYILTTSVLTSSPVTQSVQGVTVRSGNTTLTHRKSLTSSEDTDKYVSEIIKLMKDANKKNTKVQ